MHAPAPSGPAAPAAPQTQTVTPPRPNTGSASHTDEHPAAQIPAGLGGERAPRSDRPWRLAGIAIMWGAMFALAIVLVRASIAEHSVVDVSAADRTTVSISLDGFTPDPAMRAQELPDGPAATIGSDGRFGAVNVPSDRPSVVGLFDGFGRLRGLTVVDPVGETAAIDGARLSQTTTAQTLLMLMPGVLSRDDISVQRAVTAATITPEFDLIEQAVLQTEDLLAVNEELEFAIAATVGVLPIDPVAAPGCAGVIESAGLEVAGLCITAEPQTGPDGNAVRVTNQLDRWVLVFDANDGAQLCALVPPGPSAGILQANSSCSSNVNLAAPGPFSPDRALGPGSEAQVQLAATFDAFASYAVPLADLAYGTDGELRSATIERLAASMRVVNRDLRLLLDNNLQLREDALVYGDPGVPPAQRARATSRLTAALLTTQALDREFLGSRVEADTGVGGQLVALIARSASVLPDTAPVKSWPTTSVAATDLSGLGWGAS